MVPELLLCTRYGVGIKDQRWFDHREQVFGNITAPSILAQTNRNFTWAIFIDADMPGPARAKLEEMVAPFGDKVVLHTQGLMRNNTVAALARTLGLVSAEGMMLTGRIDDDDAYDVETVQTVYDLCEGRLQDGTPLDAMVITFDYGIEWVMYDIYDIDMRSNRGVDLVRKAAIRPYRATFQGDSVFMLSRAETNVTCFAAGHGQMKKYMDEHGYEIRVVSPERPMWLYSRHKQVSTALVHGLVEPLKLTTADLSRMFGINQAGVDRYIEIAGEYEYLLEKRTEHRRNVARKALAEFDSAHAGTTLTPDLEEQRRQLANEVAKLSTSLLGSVEEFQQAAASSKP